MPWAFSFVVAAARKLIVEAYPQWSVKQAFTGSGTRQEFRHISLLAESLGGFRYGSIS
jgi:Holliday junction resolvasome RuvABC endonuclease subunit